MAHALRTPCARRAVVALAPPSRSGPAVGAVPASGVVKAQFRELYDYDELRKESEATMYAIRPERGTLVLGSKMCIRDSPHRGRLPRAVRSEEPRHDAGLYLEVQIIDGDLSLIHI